MICVLEKALKCWISAIHNSVRVNHTMALELVRSIREHHYQDTNREPTASAINRKVRFSPRAHSFILSIHLFQTSIFDKKLVIFY